MSNLDADGWELESAEQRHADSSGRFQIPSRAERSALTEGQMVKLLFLFLNQDAGKPILECERMWVTITSVSSDGYVGRLESLPASSEVLRPGDLIEFRAEHVCSVFIKKDEPRHPDYSGSR